MWPTHCIYVSALSGCRYVDNGFTTSCLENQNTCKGEIVSVAHPTAQLHHHSALLSFSPSLSLTPPSLLVAMAGNQPTTVSPSKTVSYA